MRHPHAPSSNGHSDGQPQRSRSRGAIRTHLGRKRTGPRTRTNDDAPANRILTVEEMQQRQDEDLFDRLRGQAQSLFEAASEKTLSAFDSALDAACDTVVSAGEFTVDAAQRVRESLRRDLLHRDQPNLTFRTGEITSAGVLVCDSCEWTLQTSRTTLLPPCPHCGETVFRKSA